MMKKIINLLLIIMWPVLFSSSQSQKPIEAKQETLSTVISKTKQTQEEIKETLESIDVILPNKKLPRKQQVRTEVKKYVRFVPVIIRDTIMTPCDTLTVFYKPAPTYGGGSIQKALWKPDTTKLQKFLHKLKRKK